MLFKDFLKQNEINPYEYLKVAKKHAEMYDINPKNLYFSDKPKYKLYYDNNGKYIYFGANLYGDFIIYLFLEELGKVERYTARKKQQLYRKRATRIKGNWKNDKFSKNNLAINILW